MIALALFTNQYFEGWKPDIIAFTLILWLTFSPQLIASWISDPTLTGWAELYRDFSPKSHQMTLEVWRCIVIDQIAQIDLPGFGNLLGQSVDVGTDTPIPEGWHYYSKQHSINTETPEGVTLHIAYLYIILIMPPLRGYCPYNNEITIIMSSFQDYVLFID